MGAESKILLVALALLLSPAGLAAKVEASQYRQFWLWAGVKPQPVLAQAQVLYLLQGQIEVRDGKPSFSRQGPLPSKLSVPSLWLSYRVHSLNWDESIWQPIEYQLASWRRAGVSVQGIQIDFDAATGELAGYQRFLQQVRARLPQQYQLSITGLMDWANQPDKALWQRIGTSVDEIVFQTYRGRQTVANYQRYLPRLLQLPVPFKIGLVQQGDWDLALEAKLRELPAYRGTVVFLLNP